MSEYTDKRNAAIKRFYGPVAEVDFRVYECNLWYVPTADKCQAFEPSEREDDGFTTAISKSTAKNAMYPIHYTEK